ncbi:MAG TPA: malto-oligosyltrehalose trehalohydrolase [Mesorhizobium sp.]|nr:malto-oligosyltrehalose trehalohydrolase [Mesorhizobium sp.]
MADTKSEQFGSRFSFGPELLPDGVRFRFWAPKYPAVGLKLSTEGEPRAMRRLENGWHELDVHGAAPGTGYQYVLPDGLHVPDPGSRFQPDDVHGPSEVVDPAAYEWKVIRWQGRPWEECVIYELHVGAFTPEGTFRAATERLDELAELGITAIELMPIADFPGKRNWGYDGVLLFAPDSSYGRPEDLKAFIDASHERGIAVLLDVVYNHFGPDGNYLPNYAPIFTEKHKTPWGAAVNYDGEGSAAVRQLVLENALYWTQDFRFDGLRLDAVHAIMDDNSPHILEEIAEAVRTAAGERHVHLILENEENSVSRLERDDHGRARQFTAQWNDDVHHVLHTAASGESAGYYGEYAGSTELLGRALAEGFAFQGQMMGYRGHPRGEPSAGLPPTAFVSFIQNHDQVGNRAFGDRLTATVPTEAVRAATAVYLLAPQIPMLFMGEEWAASQPFPFFCDFDAELSKAVREGRRAEFARFPEFADPESRERIPDPTAESTFRSAKLNWDEAAEGIHSEWRDWYRRLLKVRQSEIVPRLRGMGGHTGKFEVLGEGAVQVRWNMGDGSRLTLAANLSSTPLSGHAPPRGRALWSEGSVEEGLGSWAVMWTIVGGTT